MAAQKQHSIGQALMPLRWSQGAMFPPQLRYRMAAEQHTPDQPRISADQRSFVEKIYVSILKSRTSSNLQRKYMNQPN